MKKVTKAIIPAAGLGTRFLPITKAVPKPMLPVLDKPTIQYIAEELNSIGIKDVVIVVSPESDVIERHFTENKTLKDRLTIENKTKLLEIYNDTEKYNVKFVVQEQLNGLAGAILCAEKYIGDEPFALLLGDELLYAGENDTPCIKRLKDVYEKTGKSAIATMEVFGDDVSKYGNIGVLSEDDGIITISEIVEKPALADALSNYAIIGRYVLDGKVMKMLKTLKPHGQELYLTDVLDELAKNEQLVASCFEGERYDVGDKVGYVKANVIYALRNKETAEEVRQFIKEIAEKL